MYSLSRLKPSKIKFLMFRDHLSFMGVAHEPGEEADPEPDAKDVAKRQQRKKFLSKLRGLVGKLTTAIEENADAACDQMGKRLMAEVDLLFQIYEIHSK